MQRAETGCWYCEGPLFNNITTRCSRNSLGLGELTTLVLEEPVGLFTEKCPDSGFYRNLVDGSLYICQCYVKQLGKLCI